MSEPPAPPPTLRLLRYLVLLERLQAYHCNHPTYQILLYSGVLLAQRLYIPNPTPGVLTLLILGWSLLLITTTTRRLATYLFLPIITALSFRQFWSLYFFLRGDAPPGWRDSFVVITITGSLLSTLYTLYNFAPLHVFAHGGVKGLLVVEWRAEYEARMATVMAKHERAMTVFCAHMLEWMMVCTAVHPRPSDSIKPTSVTGTPDITRWTSGQLLLFQSAANTDDPPVPGFTEMLASSTSAITGFVENAREIVNMEEMFLTRMRASTKDFSVIRGGDKKVEEWCMRVWDPEFCEGRGRRLRCLAWRLEKCWTRMWRVMGVGELPHMGERLPREVTEALRWFLKVESGKWEAAVRAEMEAQRKRMEKDGRRSRRVRQAGL